MFDRSLHDRRFRLPLWQRLVNRNRNRTGLDDLEGVIPQSLPLHSDKANLRNVLVEWSYDNFKMCHHRYGFVFV